MTLDIAGAYPEEAGIKSWERTVTLIRGKEVGIVDRYDLKAVTGTVTMNVLTACEAKVTGAGQVALKAIALGEGRTSGSATLCFDADVFDVALETVVIADGWLKTVWGGKLMRIVLSLKNPQPKGEWTLRVTR